MSKWTIIQAYTDAIYTHTKKCSGGWATTVPPPVGITDCSFSKNISKNV